MTDVIDLYFSSREQSSNRSYASFNSRQSKRQIKHKQINQVIEKFICKIDKNYIKTIDSYIFRLSKAKIKIQAGFYNNNVKLVGCFQIKKQQYSLRIQFQNQKGQKIIVKSPYHRVLMSNFVLQINAQLENFKIQYNPISGDSYFVFNAQSQSGQIGGLYDFLEFSLNNYFEQCSAHFYLLNLLQHSNQNENNYLKSIKDNLNLIKHWICQRLNENKQSLQQMGFYQNYLQQIYYKKKIYKNTTLQIQNQRHFEQIQKYLYPQTKYINQPIQISQNKIYKIYKKFQNYYKQEQIFSLHLLNKINHQNYLSVSIIQTNSLISFLTKRGILNQKQINSSIKQNKDILQYKNKQYIIDDNQNNYQFDTYSQYQQSLKFKDLDYQIVNINDKNNGKSFLVKSLFLTTRQSAVRQYKVCQKFCQFQSFKFLNQYFILNNYQSLKNGYAFVNANPKRVLLTQFIQNNIRVLSINAKIKICINILQIILIIQKKNKISNYFPSFAPNNLQVSQNLYVNIKILSYMSRYPLFQICNTISYIFFGKSISYIKKNTNIAEIVKGDQSQNKYWGPSYCILFLKYYLLQLHQQTIRMKNILQPSGNKKIPQQYFEQVQNCSRKRITTACQQMLVIFNNYQTMFDRGYDEEYSLSKQEDDDIQT